LLLLLWRIHFHSCHKHLIQSLIGSFYNNLGAVDSSECLACPRGRYCPQGTSDPYYDSNVCPRGSYCPASTGSPINCNAGLYTEETGSTGVEFCKVGFSQSIAHDLEYLLCVFVINFFSLSMVHK